MTSPSDPTPPRRHSLPLYITGVALVVLAVFGVATLASARRTSVEREASERHTAVAAGPRVRVVHVGVSEAARKVTLPGEVRAFTQATLYAKVSGYLKEIRVDKGDRVKAGQLLAVLESPDADQQEAAAEADLANKVALSHRATELAKSGVVSQQDAENAEAAVKVAQAALSRAKANQAYESLRAPFSGVITTRYADPGALLPAATGSTQSAQPVVDIADIDHLRIYVYLGQDDASLVREGDAAAITVDGRPGEVINAKVTRLSHSLDARTRTMLSEIDVDNQDAKLLPGAFVHVQMNLQARPYPMVPTEALISRGDKLLVAVVKGGKAHLVPVTTGQDDGKSVQVVSGLQGGEVVAVNAAGEVQDNAPVQAVESPTASR